MQYLHVKNSQLQTHKMINLIAYGILTISCSFFLYPKLINHIEFSSLLAVVAEENRLKSISLSKEIEKEKE